MRPPACLAQLTLLATLAACGNAAEPARSPEHPVQVDVPARPASPAASAATTPALPAAPPGEHWLSVEDAARVVVAGAASRGYLLAAKVSVDEQHGAHMHSPRSGTVTTIGVTPGQRVKAGAPLLTIDTGAGAAGKTITIKSPIAGEVIAIAVAQGGAVTGAEAGAREATELVFVADLDRVVLTTTAAPPGQRVGATVSFRVPEMADRVFQGEVSWVADDGSQLRTAMANADHTLHLGMSGTLLLEQENAGRIIPRTALQVGSPAAGAAPRPSVVIVKRGNTPDGRVRFVETPAALVFDGGASSVTVSGLVADLAVVTDAGAFPGDPGGGPPAPPR